MVDKFICMYFGIIIYGGAIVTLFVRALLRRRLLKDHDDLIGTRTRVAACNLSSIFSAIPNQTRALRELSTSLPVASDDIQRRYRRFTRLSWVSTVFIFLLIVFSIIAHEICGV